MKTLFITTFIIISTFLMGQNKTPFDLEEINKYQDRLGNVKMAFTTWDSYQKEFNYYDNFSVKEDSEAKIKIASVDFSQNPNASIQQITYFFSNDMLINYTLTYRNGEKPSIEELCELYGDSFKAGSTHYWRSKDQHIYANSTEEGNDIVFTFQRGVCVSLSEVPN